MKATRKAYKFFTVEPMWGLTNMAVEATPVFRITAIARGDCLGHLDYYKPWKKWVFVPQEGTIWSDGCMRDVLDFLGRLQENGPLFLKEQP